MKLTKRALFALMPALAFLTFKSKGGGGGSQTSITKQELDPDVKEKWLSMYGVAEDVADLPYTPYTGNRIAQYDPLQIKGFEAYQNALGTGAGTLNNAINTASQSAGYTPYNVSALSAASPQRFDGGDVSANYNVADVSAGTMGPVGNVTANGVNTLSMGSNFSDYMNPYTQQVIDPALADLQQAYGIQKQQQAGAATASGAFGGSRHGVQAALGDQAYYGQAGQLSAGLHNQGFNTAMQGFLTNAGMQQQGDLANQGAALAAAQGNQAAGITTGQANLDAYMSSALANQQSGLTSASAQHQAALANQGAQLTEGAALQNAQLSTALANQHAGMSAQELNQSAGLQNAQQQQGAAALLAALSGQQRDQGFGDAQVQVDLGAEQQGFAQSELDLAYSNFLDEQNHPKQSLDTLMAAYGISPQLSGSTTTTTKS